jgi:hypothetical protein
MLFLLVPNLKVACVPNYILFWRKKVLSCHFWFEDRMHQTEELVFVTKDFPPSLVARFRKCTRFLLRSAWVQHKINRKQKFWAMKDARSVLTGWERIRGIRQGREDPKNLLGFISDLEIIMNEEREV